MVIHIDNARFQRAHEAFKKHLYVSSGGRTFNSFNHTFLWNTEIYYKRTVFGIANKALHLEEWERWRDTPGSIVQAVKEACHPSISKNLLEHRFGFENSSEKALYTTRGIDQVVGLETRLFDFFKGVPNAPDTIGARFDGLADFLRQERLGCNWAFSAYLTFLLDCKRYFPIRPSRFDALLKYYGNSAQVSHHVSWERYSYLLELADLLRSKLARYEFADAIDIQSYMWVVSYLLKNDKVDETLAPPKLDLEAELASRQRSARERERIGLLGEEFVLECEKDRLRKADRNDLANRVAMVSCGDESLGYDVLSFDVDGDELHIEVKTTSRSREADPGFWLSENERSRAELDSQWTLYRVWSVDSSPVCEDLGNVPLGENDGWMLEVSSWHAHRRRDQASP